MIIKEIEKEESDRFLRIVIKDKNSNGSDQGLILSILVILNDFEYLNEG